MRVGIEKAEGRSMEPVTAATRLRTFSFSELTIITTRLRTKFITRFRPNPFLPVKITTRLRNK